MPLPRILRVLFTAVVLASLVRGALAQGLRVNAPLPLVPGSGEVWDDVIELEWARDSRRLLYTATDRIPRLPSLDVYSADLAQLDLDGSIPVVRLGTGGGIEVSPTGEWAAFAMSDPCELWPCTTRLRAAPIDGSAPARVVNQLTGLMREYRFTADGEHLVHLGQNVAVDFWVSEWLASVPSDGSGPAVHLSVPQGGPPPGPGIGSFADAADGRVVFTEGHDLILQVYSVPVEGGTPATLGPPWLGPGSSLRELRVTPDGRTAVFAAYVPERVTYDLFFAPSDGSGPLARLGPPAAPGSILAEGLELDSVGERAVFVRDRALCSAPLDFRQGMFGLRLSARPVPGGGVALPGSPGGRAQFTLAPDGSRAVYRAEQDALGRFELFSVPLDGSAAPVRLHAPLADAQDVAPDAFAIGAGRVVFIADLAVPGTLELFGSPLDGSGPPVRLNAPFPAGGGLRSSTPSLRDVFALSPDGLTVAYLADQLVAGTTELFAVPADGSRAPRRLNRELVPGGDVGWPGMVIEPFAFSPDGRLVAYLADQDVDEVVELFVSWIDPPRVRRAPPPRPLH